MPAPVAQAVSSSRLDPISVWCVFVGHARGAVPDDRAISPFRVNEDRPNWGYRSNDGITPANGIGVSGLAIV